MGKSHKLSFNQSKTVYNKPLKLIESDLWGPSPVDSDYGFKYYISFVDAYSRNTWIYFLKIKSETHDVVTQFIVQAKKQLNNNVKIFQANGGLEF